MAATNYTPIQLYYSTTASAAPVAGNLTNGELAINITDGKLYYKDNGGVVQVIATKGAGTIGGSNTQIQYNNSGALAGSSAMTFNSGTNTVTLTTLNLTNALGATYGGTAQSSYTQGDILYSSATNTLSKLGIGTVNYILTSTGSVPQWVAPTSVTVQTANNLAGGAAGSVPYQSAPDTTTFLSIGAANRVMTSSGTAPQWVTALTGLTGVSSSSITNTSLTSGRVVYSTTGGAQTDSSNLTFNGTTLSAGGFSTSGLSTLVKTVTIGNSNFDGSAVFAAATPAKLYIGTGTVTDTTSAIGATNATGAISSLAITPIAATNTSVTYTNAATLYIAGAPSAGTNVTLTNPYALYVAAGASYFGGAVTYGAGLTLGGNLLFNPDNTYDIGASGANRPQSIYLGTNMCAANGAYVGTTTFTNNGRNSQRVLAVNTAADYGGMAMTSYCGTTSTIAPILDFNRSRGSADQSLTAVVSGDRLGFINFRGASGTQFVDAAQIFSYVDGTVTTTSVPGAMSFGTSSTTLGLVGRYNINSSGIHLWQNVGSDTGGTALQLNATGLIITNGLQVGSNTTLNGGTIYLGNATTNDFITTTSDGSDTSAVRINGGGAITVARGAMFQAFGNENSSYPGHCYVDQGNVTGAYTYFRYGNINIGAEMAGNGYWKFYQAVGFNADPDLAKATVRAGSNAAAFRAQNAGSVRYRSDWAVGSSGITSFNSYDDTAGAYKPFRFDGTELTVTNGLGTTYAQLVPNGLRVSSNGSYSSLDAANLIYAGRAALSTNSSANVMRITDGSNADFNVNLRSGASVSVSTGTAEMQTAAYNMWLSTQGSTGALKITDTVNNGNGGQVTKPFNACFSASGTDTSCAANTTLIFYTEYVDKGSNYNASTGRFTAPVSGAYWFSVNIRWDNNNGSNTYFGVQIFVNGATVTRADGDIINRPANEYGYSTVGVVVNLSAGDYVQAGSRQNTGTTFNTTGTENSFNGFLIG